MRILIMGGTGAMGSHLVGILAADPANELTVTTRKEFPSVENGCIRYVRGNAHDIGFFRSLVPVGAKWDCIVDFMVYTPDEFRERVDFLLSVCKQYVFLSSARVYAGSNEPIVETSPRLLDTVNDEVYLRTDEYALAKAREENLLSQSGKTNWVIVRPYITYSEIRLQLGVLEKEQWLYRAMNGRKIVFPKDIAEKMTTLTYGYDVACGIAAVAGKPAANGRAFHVTAAEAIRWSDVLGIYLDVLETHLGTRPGVVMPDAAPNLKNPETQYQVRYDRWYDRKFDNTQIDRFCDTAGFTKPADGLRFCLERFVRNPRFAQIVWTAEARCDRITGERTPLREIPSVKFRLAYLAARYMPRNLFELIRKLIKR